MSIRHTRAMRGPAVAVALALVCLTCLPASAAGQADDVFVDPDSPSGREYEIPLERARRDVSAREPSASRGPSAPAPLFGAGVGSAPEAAASGRSPKRPGRERAARARADAPAALEAAIRQPGAPDSAAGASLMLGGAAAAILLLGAALGFSLRRSRR